jgi:hypothetical protein
LLIGGESGEIGDSRGYLLRSGQAAGDDRVGRRRSTW